MPVAQDVEIHPLLKSSVRMFCKVDPIRMRDEGSSQALALPGEWEEKCFLVGKSV